MTVHFPDFEPSNADTMIFFENFIFEQKFTEADLLSNYQTWSIAYQKVRITVFVAWR